jgi:formate dehydrogenase major subunit
MEIETHPPEIERLRRTMLALLSRNYPEQHVAQWPEKEFHRLLNNYRLTCGNGRDRLPAASDDSHPYIHVDMSRCIDCYRCVRICDEVQGQCVWRLWNRGNSTQIRPDSGATLRESSCVSCGACVDACPTGALEDKSLLSLGSPTRWTRTTCSYCGTGCELYAGTRNDRIVSIKPALDAPVSRGHLCVKGRYAFEFVYARDRVLRPMIRTKGNWKEVTWDEAIQFTAHHFQRMIDRYGPDAIGVLGSARATNEENYLAQKFARVVLGTNNIDCCARVCHAPSAAALKSMLGTGAATNSFADIEKAQAILLCGANATENHPIIGARIKQAALGGAKLVVIDPRQIELTQYASCHLQLRPGTNVPLLNAMASTIIEEGLCDTDFLDRRVSGSKQFRKSIAAWTAERAARICGVDARLIRKAARLYATEKPAICFHGLGTTEHVQGTEGVMCLVNLALLTGNLGKPGTGVNPLRGQNNVQGAAHMGCDPKNLTGSIPLAEANDVWRNLWDASVPSGPGLNLIEMMQAADSGTLRGLWAIGYDVYLTNPNSQFTANALRKMDCVVVQDMFLNETAREFGTVFLPAASSFEKDGTFMNSERRVQRVRKVIEPPGQAGADWQIICDVAKAMGHASQFRYSSPEEIWNEIRTLWKAGAGISYPRLEKQGLQWPCPSEDHAGTEILHASGPQIALRTVEYQPSCEAPSDEFPFTLVSGRTLYQFNAGTMTMRTENAALLPGDFLHIAPEDARKLSLADQERVRMRSHYAQVTLPVRIDPSIQAGSLFATFHTPEVFLNALTTSNADPYTITPEYKITAVQVEKL